MTEKHKQKETIITIAAGFTVLFLIFRLEWILLVALGVLLAGILSPLLTRYIHIAWFLLADKLGFVMSKLIFGITFLVILIPVGTLSKIFRKDFMMLKRRNSSYYRNRNHVFLADDLNDPW